MSAIDLQLRKLKVMELLLHVSNEQLVEQMEKILEREMIVAYTTQGKPLTLKAYNKRLEIAKKQIQDGKTTSHDDLKSEMSKW
jgi:hypothetical protein